MEEDDVLRRPQMEWNKGQEDDDDDDSYKASFHPVWQQQVEEDCFF